MRQGDGDRAALDPTTPAGVARLARLARLPLEPGEAEALGRHFARMVAWLERLEAADPGGAPLEAPAVSVAALRADRPRASLAADDALALGPETAGGLFRVPPVLPGEEPA